MPRTIGDQTRTSILVCRIAGERLQEFLQLVNDFEDAPPRFCLEREVWLKVREPEVYCLVERWPNLASLRSHQASDAHRALLGGIRALGALESHHLLGADAPAGDGVPALADLLVHDLRSPVATVSTLLSVVEERIAETPGLEEETEDLRVAGAECRRISQMLSNLLMLSRIERKRLRPAWAATAVRELLEEVAGAIGPRAAAATVAVLVDADATVARLDRKLTRRLLDNLAENALRHVRVGDRIQLASRAEGEQSVRIAVRNTGPAVPAHVRAKLFHADLFGDVAAGGAGLGLHMCRLVAEAHAGSISLVDRAGWNVSFEVVLPLRAGPGRAP